MASPKKPLTANDVEADPALLRHPDAREKTDNRSGAIAVSIPEHLFARPATARSGCWSGAY